MKDQNNVLKDYFGSNQDPIVICFTPNKLFSLPLLVSNLDSNNQGLVITDLKGSVIKEYANALVMAGYDIKALNLDEMDKSMCYIEDSHKKDES